MVKDMVTSCCGLPISDCQGCPERMSLMTKEEYMQDIEAIAKKIGIDWEKVEFTKDQLSQGIDTEMKEHHDDPETQVISGKIEAAKVAWAHLKEDPKYYDKLKKMEESTILSTVLLKIENKTVSIEDFDQLINEATPASVIDRVRRKINPLNKVKRRRHDDSGHAPGMPKFAARINPARKRSDRTQMQHGGKHGHDRSVKTQARNRRRDSIGEAIEFIKKNIGKEIRTEDIKSFINRPLLREVAIRLMAQPNINRDWLKEFIDKVTNV